jgi:hypothetical protein
MPRGRKNLQEMEVGTKHVKNVVNSGAKPAEPMPKLTNNIPDGQTSGWEDLGGPTPQDYKPDNDSAKLKDPAAILAQVRDVVNRGAGKADAMQKLAKGAVKESSEDDEDYEVEDEDFDYDEDVEDTDEVEDDDAVEEASSYQEDDEEEDDEEEDEDEDSSKDKKEDKKEKAKKKAKEVEEQIEVIENQIEEDVEALLSGEELSEEFKFKAKTVFEAALNARTEQIEEAIIAKYEEQLAEEIEVIAESLTERVDAYLEYVAQEWLEENAIAIEQGLRSEMTESFLENLKELFENHYVSIPEERYDVLETMAEKLDEMETKLNEQIERNITLNKRLAESVTDVIFSDVSEGLAVSQKDKLASLAENVEFDSEEEYREKLVALKESYFPSNSAGTHRNTQDYLVEDTNDYSPYNTPSGTMGIYLSALERVSKK